MPTNEEQTPPPHDPNDADSKVVAYRLKAIETRQNEGAKTFAEVRNTLSSISKSTDERLDKAIEKITISQAASVEKLGADNRSDNAHLRHDVMQEVGGLKKDIDKIKDELRPKLIRILGMVGALLVVIIPVAVMYGKQPGRDEIETIRQRQTENTQAIHDAQLRIDGINKSLDSIERNQRSVTDKLDQLILRGVPKP